ncbi:helix-turn-helix domain-containing protein [Rathayibacter sp. AY1C1]|uniref:helix-turn-helix domain-containing protein n=1 Tax=Rathayibacter sp. AY1C1 TaxID=2080534 RepID=UPI0028006D72|nr:helix-turn-helix domain-containing protein [Rathayibacter sp. AY1C1]
MDGDERWRILRLHVEDQIPLAALARDIGIGLRTLQRWHQLYRESGVTALDPHQRSDAGVRRTPPELVAFIERLALSRPRPALTTLHRLASAEADHHGLSAPSYATVREIVQALDPALVTLALEGPAANRDKHELVFRRRAERPNHMWQADHTELDILIMGTGGARSAVADDRDGRLFARDLRLHRLRRGTVRDEHSTCSPSGDLEKARPDVGYVRDT